MKIEEKSKYKFIVHDIKLLPINKGNTTYQSNKLCRKTCKHNKERQSNYKICKEIDNSEPWMNKDSGLFDATMGAYDGAEVCELVGTYLLYKFSLKYNKNNIGLYRNNGLAIFKNISGPKSEKFKKDIQKLFKENELDIVIQCNLKTVNYLDVTVNLENSAYRPYQKDNKH